MITRIHPQVWFFVAVSAFLIMIESTIYSQTASFPSALATDANLKVALNSAQSQLTSAINSSTTSLPVASCSPFVANMLVTVDQEIFSVSSCVSTTMLVAARPFPDGANVATSHVSGALVTGYIDAWHHNVLRVEIEAIEAALGASLVNVVTIGSTPTLAGLIVNGAITANSLTTSGSVIANGTLSATNNIRRGGLTLVDSSCYYLTATTTCFMNSAGDLTAVTGTFSGAISTGSITATGSVTSTGTLSATNNIRRGGVTLVDSSCYHITGSSACFVDSSNAATFNTVNYIATETGVNNAIAGTLSNAPGLVTGLTVQVQLAHTLQAGANTFNYTANGPVAIRSHFNTANNVGTAYAATGFITLQYNGTVWVDTAQ